MTTDNSGRRMMMEAHCELMQEWKADHPNADMDEAYQATRFEVYKRYRTNNQALYDEACETAEDIIDNLTFH